MLKISHASCFGLSSAILVQFTFEMRLAARNREKFTKTRYFGGSRSFKVIDVTFLRSWMPVLVMINSMSVPICNHFHVRRAYSGKIPLFKAGTPLSPPSSRRSPLPSGMKFCHEIPVKSLSHLVLDWYRVVTDGQTDRQTELS